MDLTAALASSRFCAIITPLPNAKPSALTTTGNSFLLSMYSTAFCALSKTSYSAVGMLYFFIRSFEKTLLASITAALAFGPKALMPAASNASTIPAASGSSGATNARSMLLSFANCTIFSLSITGISTQILSREIPPLPGAVYSFVTCGLSSSFFTSACSLPPEPIIKIFISNLFLFISDGTVLYL